MSEVDHWLLERRATTNELNKMFEHMDVDSERIEASDAPGTTREGNITSDSHDPMDVDTNDYSGPLDINHSGPMDIDTDGSCDRIAEPPVAFSEASSRLEPNGSKPWPPRKPERTTPSTILQNRRDKPIAGNATTHSLIRRAPKRLDAEASRMKQTAHVLSVYHKLMGANPLQSFNKNCESVLVDWNRLKSETAIPDATSSSDSRIVHAFKAIDNVICGIRGSTLLRRLAYVRLMQLFTFVENLVRFERESGRVKRGRCCRDASVALDVYISAQEGTLSPSEIRQQVKQRKRVGKKWTDLSKPSPLLVLIYSGAADSIVCVFISLPRSVDADAGVLERTLRGPTLRPCDWHRSRLWRSVRARFFRVYTHLISSATQFALPS
ncbi:hypothetical protein AUP68_05448 [Ilyonectria robusta]